MPAQAQEAAHIGSTGPRSCPRLQPTYPMRSSLLLLTLSLPFSLAAGCDIEDADEPSGCDCIVDEDDANPPSDPSGPTCGESLCDEVSASSDGYTESPLVVSNPEALECALTALRDGTPGIVRWRSSQYDGQYQEQGYLQIHKDRTAVRRTYGPQDLSYTVSDAVLGALPSADHFAGCLAQSDDSARFDCLTANLQPTEVCDMGWSYDTL